MRKEFEFSGSTVEFFLATAVAMLALRVVGSILGLVIYPIMWGILDTMHSTTDHANLAATFANVVSLLCTFALLSWGAASQQISLFRKNQRLLSVAAIISIVFAAQVVLGFLGSQVELFVVAGTGYVALLDIVLPAIGLALLLLWNSRRIGRANAGGAI